MYKATGICNGDEHHYDVGRLYRSVFLGVRDYPSVDPPIISVSTSFPGANADVIETQITEPLGVGYQRNPGDSFVDQPE